MVLIYYLLVLFLIVSNSLYPYAEEFEAFDFVPGAIARQEYESIRDYLQVCQHETKEVATEVLFNAIRFGSKRHKKIVDVALDFDADVTKDMGGGITSLHVSAAKKIVKRKTDKNKKHKLLAKLLSSQEVLEKIDTSDSFGNSPLHYAAQAGNWKSIKELLFYGACPHKENNAGVVPANLTNSSKFHSLVRKKGALCVCVCQYFNTICHLTFE
jgi:hypothetical protein